jgi:hypothetical protein
MWDWLGGLASSQATIIGTSLGALLGFVSLTSGALFNAKLNRDRDQRIVDMERVSLLRALSTEIHLIRNLLTYQLGEYTTPNEQEWQSSVSPKMFSLIYPANIQKLISLPADALTQTIIFHAAIDEYEYNLQAAGVEFPDHGSVATRSFNFPASCRPRVIELANKLKHVAEQALHYIDSELDQLEKRLNLPSQTKRLNDLEYP